MRIFILAIATFFVFTGCSSKKYFEPKEIAGSVEFKGSLPSKIEHIKRGGATLANSQVITKDGILDTKIKEGFVLIGDDKDYLISISDCGKLMLTSKKDSSHKEIEFGSKVVSASLEGNLLALVLSNNSTVLYDINANKELFSQKEQSTYANSTIAANPYFLKDILLFPTLDGKVLVLDKNSRKQIRNIVVDDETFFNNVIFLEVLDDRLVAATQKKVISVSPESINTFDADVRDIVLVRGGIYILTKDGRIVLTDSDLKPKKEQKFPFAHFNGAIHGKYIYTIEKEGFLVATDVDLKDYNVYELPSSLDSGVFAVGDRFYTSDRYFELTK